MRHSGVGFEIFYIVHKSMVFSVRVFCRCDFRVKMRGFIGKQMLKKPVNIRFLGVPFVDNFQWGSFRGCMGEDELFQYLQE